MEETWLANLSLERTWPQLMRMREPIRLSMLSERLERLHALIRRYLESA